MNLSAAEFESIVSDFPKFELSYETMAHKKVHNSDMLLAIPEGQRCFAWFTSYKEDDACFILFLNEHQKIVNAKIAVTKFNYKLAFGTIFYGTQFHYNKTTCFSIEDIYYYKGKSYHNINYADKLKTLASILATDINQSSVTAHTTIFGVPLMETKFDSMLRSIEELPYKIRNIQFRFFDNKRVQYIKYFKPRNHTQKESEGITARSPAPVVFKITPEVEPDIYNLWIYNNGQEEYYDVAFIPNYETSVFMNKLFRNIKENANLDALEESDDEGEFEDNREDKFVYLDRSFKIQCEYNAKFKRWIPVRLADTNSKLVSRSQLDMMKPMSSSYRYK